ncbi:MAG: hypothetical protein KA447_03265 [Pyrinomonadaceae bacterium]|nr:hypothetical protein [Pyrinomonadaceae bacterium]
MGGVGHINGSFRLMFGIVKEFALSSIPEGSHVYRTSITTRSGSTLSEWT